MDLLKPWIEAIGLTLVSTLAGFTPIVIVMSIIGWGC